MYIAHLSTAVTLNQTVLNRMVFQRKNGHRVVALCPEDEWTQKIRDHGIEVIDVPFLRHNMFHSFTRAALRTYQVCRRERFDVVHTHTLLPGIAGRVAARFAGVPMVVHTFHSWVLHKPRSLPFRLAYQTLEVMAAHSAHAILFQNGDDLRCWKQITGMPKEKALLIGNGIDIQAIIFNVKSGAREAVRNEFGIKDDVTLIAMVARLELYKGHKMLLDAIKHIVSSTNHKVSVLFVGIGKDRPEIEEEVHRLDLDDIVHFTGYRQDVPNILSASDISVLTSRYEGIPRALMESMVLGIPVIATDVPGTRTLIRAGENGLLVEHGDVQGLASALLQYIRNPGLRKQLADNGLQTILDEYDEYKIASREEELYRQAFDNKLARLSGRKTEAD